MRIGGSRHASPGGTVTIVVDRLDINLERADEPIAEAMAAVVAAEIRGITLPVSPATVKREGGRVRTYANRTGILANSIRSVPAGDHYEIRSTPLRLRPETFGERYEDFRRRLAGLVPALSQPGTLFAHPAVKQAREAGIRAATKVTRWR